VTLLKPTVDRQVVDVTSPPPANGITGGRCLFAKPGWGLTRPTSSWLKSPALLCRFSETTSRASSGPRRAIGVAPLASAGLGVFLMQTPAGMIVDPVRQRRTLLARRVDSARRLLRRCCRWSRPTWLGGFAAVRRRRHRAGLLSCPYWARWPWGWSGHAALNRTVAATSGWNHAATSAGGPACHGPGQLVRCDLRLLCGANRLGLAASSVSSSAGPRLTSIAASGRCRRG